MTEHPAAIAREAKTIYQSLKELLKTKEPFDKELEFQRKNLRKRYLTLLLLHPNAKESKDAENHLWMQTSYASISSYKERITSIDRALQASAKQPAVQPGQSQQPARPKTGPVEHRKLLSRFRQFLAEEEKFWIQLVVRMYRTFGLEEATPALSSLGIAPDSQDAEEHHEANGVRSAFPEESTTSLAASTPAERESRLAILSKALICLGDIARYRELYNENGGRPRAGHENGRPARRGRARGRGGALAELPPQPRVYDIAQQRYDQARLLVPHEGNPFHQLAILATYRKDTFASVYYYYRALCVKQPYETAADNLATVLQKALDQWRRTRKDRDRMIAANLDVKDRVVLFKEKVVVLHSLWRKVHEKLDSKLREHDKLVYQDFLELVSERHLPIDMIFHVILLSQGGLWKHRMLRDSGPRRQEGPTQAPVEFTIAMEWKTLRHLMDMHYALLEVGKDQLKDLPSMDKVDNDLAQRITAVFRRTLPAMRIASKWLRANLTYVMGDLEFQAYQEKERLRSVQVEKKNPSKLSAHSVHTIRFWKGYAQFISALSQSFPADKLPSVGPPLEEDLDVRGFLPLRRIMSSATSGDAGTNGAAQARESPHPNEEQLMRISDLLVDARALVEVENSPIVFVNGGFMFDESVIEPRASTLMSEINKPLEPVAPRQQQIMNNIRDKSAEVRRPREDDVMTEATSRTDDDVLKAAFEHIGNGDVDDDDDEIVVFNPKPTLSPTLSPRAQATPITPSKSLNGSNGSNVPAPVAKGFSSPPLRNTLSPLMGKTPIGSPRAPVIHATTAQDLLFDVMNVGRKPGTGLVPTHPPAPSMSDPSGLHQPLMYGTSDISHRPNPGVQSIWSAGRDEQLLKFGSPGHVAHSNLGGFQTSPRVYSHGLNPSQDPIWGSPHVSSTQASQQAAHLGHGLPSTIHHQSTGLHHRVPSAPQASSLAGLGGYQSSQGLGSLQAEYGQQQHTIHTSASSMGIGINVPKPPQPFSHHSFHSMDVRSGMYQGSNSPFSSYQHQQPQQPHSSSARFGGYQSQSQTQVPPTQDPAARLGNVSHLWSSLSMG